MTFNPSAVGTVGNEWRAWRIASPQLTAPSQAVAAYVNSSATETIDQLIIPYAMSGAAQSYGKLWAEVYNATDLGVNETPVVSTFVPNEDVAVSNVYYRAVGGALTGPISGGASNVDQYIDDATDEQLPLTGMDYLSVGAGTSARFGMGTAGLAAGRVLSVTIEVRYQTRDSSLQGIVAVDLYNGSIFVARIGSAVSPVANGQEAPRLTTSVSAPLYQNPLTGEPWTRTDIINMDSGTNLLLQLTGLSGTVIIAALRLKVSMISEKRVAIGANALVLAPPSGAQTANFCSMKTPALVDNWAKASATDYVVVIRRLDDPALILPSMTVQFTTADAAVANPHDQGHAYGVTIDADGRITAASGLTTAAFGLLMARSDAALSVDSQVYYRIITGDIGQGQISKQLISNAGSATYQSVRAVVGISGNVGTGVILPDQPLLFKIKKVSDNSQVGGTATLNPADVLSQTLLGVNGVYTWYDVQLDLATTATLVSGTQYYIEVSSAASVRYWVIRWLSYTATHAFTGDQSYGGITDNFNWAGTGAAQADAPLTIRTTPPTAPASVTVTKPSLALPTGGDPMCVPGVHEYGHVAWAATSDGVLFGRYEIQRSEDGGSTWVLVRRVATEATVAFDDVEAAHGVAVQYRVRSVRTNGDASAWRTQTGTTTFAVNTQSVIFSTNGPPALTVGYLWLGGEHNYEFLSDAEVSVVAMHDRDYQVAFRPLEDRGVRYEFTLLIHTKASDSPSTLQPAGGKGAAAFNPLRAVVEADAPYTTVFIPDGVRLFAVVRLPAGRRNEPGAHYAAAVTVTQTSATPAVSDS